MATCKIFQIGFIAKQDLVFPIKSLLLLLIRRPPYRSYSGYSCLPFHLSAQVNSWNAAFALALHLASPLCTNITGASVLFGWLLLQLKWITNIITVRIYTWCQPRTLHSYPQGAVRAAEGYCGGRTWAEGPRWRGGEGGQRQKPAPKSIIPPNVTLLLTVGGIWVVCALFEQIYT